MNELNSKDEIILEKFRVKESSILIGLGNFGAIGFSIMGALGWYSLINQKMTKSPLIRVLSTNFLRTPHKSFTPLLNDKITQQNDSIFRGNLHNFSVFQIFKRTYNSWPWKSAAVRKRLVNSPTKILEILHAIEGNVLFPYWPGHNGKLYVKNQTVSKPLEITVSICCFCWNLATCKKSVL